ncbi:MAG: hypothetical protein ABSE95_02180 [Thermodesulfobacteriota bacterium]
MRNRPEALGDEERELLSAYCPGLLHNAPPYQSMNPLEKKRE